MKTIFKYGCLFILAITLFSELKAQSVLIPDRNFGIYLERTFPGSITKTMFERYLNVGQAQIKNAKTINVNCDQYSFFQQISNLQGIQYFTGLTNLYCNNNILTSLPALPSKLTTLSCSNNKLTSLPQLPSSLTFLDCGKNNFTSLASLPSSLTTFHCYNNKLSSLPTLPSSLITLVCYKNYLTTLPNLPLSLSTLSCRYNSITSLPVLPSSLTTFYCSGNKLTAITIPQSLIDLQCDQNILASLPPLPSSLTILFCQNNQLTSLPTLPSTLCTLNLDGNNITCLPNKPACLASFPLPLCLPITTASVINTQCAGTTLTISYTTTQTANVGNTFTAQLSNAVGSFANPVNIGVLNATTSGTIATLIPANTLAGSAYRIRVVSSSPFAIGSDNGQNITIGVASALSLTINGSTSVCNSTSQVYNVPSANASSTYTWTVPTGAVLESGQGSAAIRVRFGTTSGNITVQENKLSACPGAVFSKVVNVINPMVLSTTPASRANAGSLVLGATVASGNVLWYYSPSHGTALATGNTFTTPFLSRSITYYVAVVDGACVSATRTPVVASINPAVATVVSGQAHSFVLKSDRTLWSSGNNSNGQLGDGTLNAHSTFTKVGTANNWSSVSTANAGAHTVALNADGVLLSCGDNTYGQLGDGSVVQRTTLLPIGMDSSWIAVSAGGAHTMAIQVNGSLWGWGYNGAGALGNGTTLNSSVPVRIGTETWLQVSAGASSSVAIKSDGTLWTWGSNSSGQLGIGDFNTNYSVSPQQIGTDNTWIKIVAGGENVFALKSDGTTWAWGMNIASQIDATSVDYYAPVQIAGNWLEINPGYWHTTALKADGTLWAWGYNGNGRLGEGADAYVQYSPVQIGSNTDWLQISAGEEFTMGVKSDGSICATGNNSNGQFGNGTLSSSMFYVCSSTAGVRMASTNDDVISVVIAKDIEVFPNPTHGVVTVRSVNAGSFAIMNELGQILKTLDLTEANNYTVLVTDLESGFYTLVSLNDTKVKSQRIVVVK